MTRLKTGESDVACMKCNMAFENGEKWAFKSPVWQQLNMRHVQLQQVHRQKDKKFQDILFKIRHGIMLSVEEWRGLEAKKQLPPGICAVRLMAQRKDVHALNMRELSKIINPPRSWAALDTYSPRFKDPETHRTPWVEENPLENHRFPKLLTLKVGAKVILLTNLDPKNGLINGSQGEVVGFEPDAGDADDPPISYLETGNDDRSGFGKKRLRWEVKTRGAPIVRFANGSKKTIFGTSMTSRFGKNISYQYLATRAQIPLTLAWALTIHKSQGMTLQYIEVLSRDIFEKGQFYVALSRGTTLAGLTVTGYTREQLPVDSDVVEFYENTEWECLTPGFQASKEEAIAKIQLPDIIGISDDDDKDDKDDEE
jgi:ATP-dependent DNA helicase PIF1